MHEYRAMAVTIDLKWGDLILKINGVNFDLLHEAKDRIKLARARTELNMGGHIKRGSFPLLCNGKLIPVSVQLNKLTKFSLLEVGMSIVTAKQREGSQKPLFPQTIAISGLAPL